MKNLTFAILLFISVSYSQKKENLQRYQVVEVENIYQAVSVEDSPNDLFVPTGVKNSVIKIDTQTGETWLLVFEMTSKIHLFNIDPDSVIHRPFFPSWFPIENYSWCLPDLPTIKK